MMLANAIAATSIVIQFSNFIKFIREYRLLKKMIEQLENNTSLNVSELLHEFKDKLNGYRKYASVKGIMRAKQITEDKNIFSVIVETPINSKDPIKEHVFDKIPYRKIIQKAFWTRPQQLESVTFNLQDLNSFQTISINSCKGSDVTGALTEAVCFEVPIQNNNNKLILALKNFYDNMSNIFPFSLFKSSRKTARKIEYYGLIDGYFAQVLGEAVKVNDNEVAIINPKYVTKQISFIIKRLKIRARVCKIICIVLFVIQLYILYRVVKWAIQKRMINLAIQEEFAEEEQDNIPSNQACIICYARQRSVIFKPCKHYGICYTCYSYLKHKDCPVCKAKITGIIRVIKR